MDISAVSQGAGSNSDNVTFSEGSGQSSAHLSFEFPPLPPPSHNFADATDASTSQVDMSIGNTVSTGSQVQTEPPLPSPSVSLSSPWGPLSSVHGAKRIFLDVCCGVNRPLSNAVLKLGGDCFSFDVLVHVSYDIFDDVVFERLLRICASGIVGYNANSPACKEYSRLKLKPNGPAALRTPDFLDGKPGLSADDLLSVQESRLMLTRCVLCASLTFDAGGHSHLEQPPSAMSWQEPEVQSFISTGRCHCTVVAACHFDRDWSKSWMVCTTCDLVSSLACTCPHGSQAHQQIAGVRADSGAYLSRYTAEYPPLLATAFAKCIIGLINQQSRDFSLDDVELQVPCKPLHSPAFVRQDGGGLTSCGDWSHPPSTLSDILQVLRQHWIHQIISQRLDKQLTHHFRIGWIPHLFPSNNCSHSNFGWKSSWRPMEKQQTGRSPLINPCTCLFYRVFSELQKIKTHLCLDTSLKVFPLVLIKPLSPLTAFHATLMNLLQILR